MSLCRVKPQRCGSVPKKRSKISDWTAYPYWLAMGAKLTIFLQIKEVETFRTSLIYKNERAISFEKLFTNMQTMSTGFSDNVKILNGLKKILLLFQKVQTPILNQIKASLQVYYDLDQANIVTYKFIANSLVAEAASLGDHTPQGVRDLNTYGDKASESGVKGAGGAIFSGFTQIGLSYWAERSYISSTRGNDSTSKSEGISSPSNRKKIAGLHP